VSGWRVNPRAATPPGGIGDLVAVFPDEGGALRDALWYCDLTTSPDGQPVSAPDRIAEIKRGTDLATS
jgi:hypothetical protein